MEKMKEYMDLLKMDGHVNIVNIDYTPHSMVGKLRRRYRKRVIINFIKQEWPAIIASVLFGALMTVAVELVVRNWEYIKTTW